MKQDRGAQAASHHDLERSPHWDKTKRTFLEKNPYCIACGPTESAKRVMQVHHREPFHYCVLAGRPDLELDHRNLVTLCESQEGEHAEDHHLILGHLRDFHSYNPQVLEHASVRYHAHSRAQIEADRDYLAALTRRPKKWPDMSEQERGTYRLSLEIQFPVLAEPVPPAVAPTGAKKAKAPRAAKTPAKDTPKAATTTKAKTKAATPAKASTKAKAP
jgi:hypothetical protein